MIFISSLFFILAHYPDYAFTEILNFVRNGKDLESVESFCNFLCDQICASESYRFAHHLSGVDKFFISMEISIVKYMNNFGREIVLNSFVPYCRKDRIQV